MVVIRIAFSARAAGVVIGLQAVSLTPFCTYQGVTKPGNSELYGANPQCAAGTISSNQVLIDPRAKHLTQRKINHVTGGKVAMHISNGGLSRRTTERRKKASS